MGSPVSDNDADSNEKPQHRVTISRSFFLGETTVTQRQWKCVMGTEPWKGKSHVKEGDNCPATYVSWFDAVVFFEKLSDSEACQYRLPTEVEWEYACRGGTETKFNFGDNESDLGRYAWFNGNTNATGEEYAHEVKLKHANPFGLYDMHGNVWEWCSDSKRLYPKGSVIDPVGPANGLSRVYRGGSWCSFPAYCRSAYRGRRRPSLRSPSHGFRAALSPFGIPKLAESL